MKQGKYAAKHTRKQSKKPLVLLMALMLVVGVAVGGTVAWLMDTTDQVVNQFTTSDITVTLTETTQTYKMIPGYTITKDPKVTVAEGSEACIVFVKLDKSANFDTYMEYTMADGWTQLAKDKDGQDITDLVFYRIVETSGMGESNAMSVLKDNQVKVKDTVTKEMMATAKTSQPSLTITAYAHQYHKSATADDTFTAADAWENVKSNPATPADPATP